MLATLLADGKSDPNNKPTFASCLVRIPGSFNAKCLEDGRGLEESKVNIVQKWNGIASKMPLEMLTDFKNYLASLKISEKKQTKIQQRKKSQKRDGTIIVVITIRFRGLRMYSKRLSLTIENTR